MFVAFVVNYLNSSGASRKLMQPKAKKNRNRRCKRMNADLITLISYKYSCGASWNPMQPPPHKTAMSAKSAKKMTAVNS